MISDAQLATAIDCEGYIGIYRSRDRRRNRYGFSPRVSLGMTNPIIPSLFKERFGSTVYLSHKVNSKHQDCYSWVIQNKEHVKKVLTILLPYLLVKKEQAQNVLDFISYRNANPAQYNAEAKAVKRTAADTDAMTTYWLKAKALNHPTPATTKRENPVMGCDSLNPLETLGEMSEESSPLIM